MAKRGPAEGLEQLKARGLSAEASVDDLERDVVSHPETAEAVVTLLGERVTPESAAALRRIETAATGKELRRAARRSLYRLSQKGIAAPVEPAATPEAPPSIFGEDEPQGFLSASDPPGDRLLWIVKARPGGGAWHVSTLVNEPGGMKEAMLAEVTRKSVRELRADLEKTHGLRLVETDWRYCDWIASEGYERARAAGTLSANVATWPQIRMQVFHKPAAPARPPIERFLDPATAADPALVAASAEIFTEPDFVYWILPPAVIGPYLARFQAMRDSPIVLEAAQQRTRLEEILADALGELFGGAGADSWRRRLEEIAYLLWQSRRKEAAQRVYAAAIALTASPGGASEIPFFEQLVRRTFSVFFAQEVEKEREERASSVLVTPDQLREEHARSRQQPPVPPPPKRR